MLFNECQAFVLLFGRQGLQLMYNVQNKAHETYLNLRLSESQPLKHTTVFFELCFNKVRKLGIVTMTSIPD